jgi:sialidase-1
MPDTSGLAKKKRFINIGLYVSLLLFYSCTKSGTINADNIFEINNSNISITDDGNGRVAMQDALSVKMDVFTADASYNGGYAYSAVLKFPDGRYYMTAVGHPGQWGDFKPSSISSKISKDSGRTWSEGQTMQQNIGLINISAPSVVNLTQNGMMSLFLVKNSDTDIEILCKESFNYGETWSGLIKVSDSVHKGYNMFTNGRVCKTRAGRMILPVAFLSDINSNHNNQIIFCYISDDNGKTWKKTKSYGAYTAITEPGITELEDGSLLMCLRSDLGYVLFTSSKDGGETWGPVSKSKIETPSSPQSIVYSFKHHVLFMVWNNSPVLPSNYLNRSVLSLAVSMDGGITWLKKGDLENNADYLYFYPSVTVEDDELLITYSWYKKSYSIPAVTFERFNIPKLIK